VEAGGAGAGGAGERDGAEGFDAFRGFAESGVISLINFYRWCRGLVRARCERAGLHIWSLGVLTSGRVVEGVEVDVD